MNKRLFVGLPLPGNILDACRDVRQRVESRHTIPSDSLRWIPGENLHVTVCFLGSLGVNLLPAIKDTMRSVIAATPPFPLTLQGIKLVPPGAEPRMIWAVFGQSQNFRSFSTKLTKSLERRLNLETHQKFRLREHRDVVAHITLARLNHFPQIISPPAVALTGALQVKECLLFESHTFPTGSQYAVLATFPFGS